ncbi:MAG: ferritin-like domain-containing protein [Candidatus Binatia bacterium]
MADHITHDPIYNTVGRDDFQALIEVDRYNERTDAFDDIIAKTHDHFWDPVDARYIDFQEPFNLEEEHLMPEEFAPELSTAVADKLDEGQKIHLSNEVTRWMVSNILHGEQGALSLSASLCHILRDPGAQEYAANQTREEARHVTAFSRYIESRWGTALPAGNTLATILGDMVAAPEVYKKLVGMQMLVEGLAMGAFATIHVKTNDPVLHRLVQLVMTDEAFHHKFGKIWADRTIPKLTEEEHEKVEAWAARCFEHLLFNLVNPEQKKVLYAQFGLDWQWVHGAVTEAFTDERRRHMMTESTNVFRVLIKTLYNAGIITERTRPIYANWVDMEELASEGEEMCGEPIAEEGIEYLKEVNAGRKRIGRTGMRPTTRAAG